MAQLNKVLSGITCLLALLTTVNADLTIGTDFLLAFPCSGRGYSSSLVIVNSNSNPSMITIESTIKGFTTMQLTVAANSGQQVNVTNPRVTTSLQVCSLNSALQLGFHVQSSIPVALYASQTPTDAGNALRCPTQYLVLPTNMLSSQYVGGYIGANDSSYYGIIVAKQDGTRITMGSKQITLNRLDVYYSAANAPVSANVPFAYIFTTPSQASLNPYQSVMSLPKSYTSTQWAAVTADFDNLLSYQIWAFQSNTQVSINNRANMTMPLNYPYEKNELYGGSITASKPVQVFNRNIFAYAYTPQMFLSSNVQFYTFDSSSTIRYLPMLLIVAPLASTGNILIDGKAIPVLEFRRIPYTQDYWHTQFFSGPAKLHTISTRTPGDRYLADMYHLCSGYPNRYQIAMNLPKMN